MYYLFDPEELAREADAKRQSLKANKPDASFTEFAAGILYERLKTNIQRYRVYGMYWWALKDVLRRQGYNVGDETDDEIMDVYKGANDDETMIAADLFYLDMSTKTLVDNNRWTIDSRKADYVLYDADMEERASITDPVPTNN